MSFAEPNLYLEPRGFPMPTIVFVSGFSQLYPYLLMQKDVWLIGGAAHVNIVFIVKWSEIARVEGRLEIWRKNQQGPENIVRIARRNIISFRCLINSSFTGHFPASPSGNSPARSYYQKGWVVWQCDSHWQKTQWRLEAFSWATSGYSWGSHTQTRLCPSINADNHNNQNLHI